jgi:hypothetical protein
VLQDHHGSGLVDDGSSALGFAARCPQRLVGTDGGEPLIDKAHSNWGNQAGEVMCKRAHFSCRRTFASVQRGRQAHHNLHRFEFTYQGYEPIKGLVALLHRLNGRGDDAGRIAASNPDPSITRIET